MSASPPTTAGTLVGEHEPLANRVNKARKERSNTLSVEALKGADSFEETKYEKDDFWQVAADSQGGKEETIWEDDEDEDEDED